ncbi:MAG: dTMP kinase [Planctomycetes bacterium]|nr:dTMP kinase [Planctomycetota bacterium]NOG54953.1 dTMP kinase [Planctomycetota bacterium]
MSKLAGRFIVFDGPDGSGKSSQFRRFSSLAEQMSGIDVCEVREPGGTSIGEQIRDILLNPENVEMDLTTEMLLYMASRAQLVSQRIKPALMSGQLVLADRFISSTLAYQGTAGGVSLDGIRAVGNIVCEEVSPDLVVLFDVDLQTAAHRLNPLLDRMEAKGAEFHERVRHGFLNQAQHDPDTYLVIDATHSEQEVFTTLLDQMAHFFESKPIHSHNG